MFDGDTAQAGRRERLMRKREAKDSYTDKIGGDVKCSARIAETPSSVPNSVFNPVAGFIDTEARRESAPRQGSASMASETVSPFFKHRVNVNRNGYEVSVWCDYPIVDMASNAKRNAISFFANIQGAEEVFTVQVPAQFDIGGSKLESGDLESGTCVVCVPAVSRNVLA